MITTAVGNAKTGKPPDQQNHQAFFWFWGEDTFCQWSVVRCPLLSSRYDRQRTNDNGQISQTY